MAIVIQDPSILLSLSHLKLSKLRIPVRKISALLVCTSAALFFQVRLSFASMIQSQWNCLMQIFVSFILPSPFCSCHCLSRLPCQCPLPNAQNSLGNSSNSTTVTVTVTHSPTRDTRVQCHPHAHSFATLWRHRSVDRFIKVKRCGDDAHAVSVFGVLRNFFRVLRGRARQWRVT